MGAFVEQEGGVDRLKGFLNITHFTVSSFDVYNGTAELQSIQVGGTESSADVHHGHSVLLLVYEVQ